jgi:hypothetical protein
MFELLQSADTLCKRQIASGWAAMLRRDTETKIRVSSKGQFGTGTPCPNFP